MLMSQQQLLGTSIFTISLRGSGKKVVIEIAEDLEKARKELQNSIFQEDVT